MEKDFLKTSVHKTQVSREAIETSSSLLLKSEETGSQMVSFLRLYAILFFFSVQNKFLDSTSGSALKLSMFLEK